ncbi:MAG: type II secretion system F family protein [bacterium]
MTLFKYKSRDNQGNLIQGELDAASADAVATYLLQGGLTPVSIKEAFKTQGFFEQLDQKMKQSDPVKPKDLIALFRQMYALIKSGVPIANALAILIDPTKSVALNTCLMGIINAISSGQTLTQAFTKYSNIFTPVTISIIDAGENSGQLELSFLRISEHLEFELNTMRQFKAVMRYPTIVITAGLAALMVINFVVIPSFSKLFSSFATKLPLPTRILVAVSDFFVYNWLYLLVAVIVIVIAIRRYLKTRSGRLLWDEYKLKIPLIGNILKQIILARFARIFAMMIQSGVPISQSLVLVARVVNNTYVSKGILFIRDGVEHGESITKTATKSNLFPPMVLQMLSVGEEAGTIDNLLMEVAKYYEEEIKYSLGHLSEMMEPILLVFMGGLVLILSLGVFLPMWNMVQFVK